MTAVSCEVRGVSVPLLNPGWHKFVEAVAERVIELLEADQAWQRGPRFVDAGQLAAMFSISRSTVYERAAEFGAVQLCDGPRARLRFDVDKARVAWTARDNSE